MTTTLTTPVGTFQISKIESNSHVWVKHLESGLSDVYTSLGQSGSSTWPYWRVKEIAAAVRAMSATKVERRPLAVSAI